MNRAVPKRNMSKGATIALLVIFFLPPFIHYTAHTSSHAVGLILVFVFMLFINFKRGSSFKEIVEFINLKHIFYLILILSFSILLSNLFFVEAEFARPFYSIIILILMIFTASMFINILNYSDNSSLVFSMLTIVVVMLLFGFMAVLDIQPYDYPDATKTMFPFSEPSHFALYSSAPLLFAAVILPFPLRLVLLLAIASLAYLIQSQSMVLVLLIISMITLNIFYISLVLSAAFILLYAALDLTYFLERIDILNSNNLSVLVYRQGWELIIDSFTRSKGLGVGFQQLGFVPFQSYNADLIYAMTKSDVNIKDGGFTLAKLLSEMGFLGFILSLFVAFYIIKSSFYLYNTKYNNNENVKLIFFHSIIASYSVEFFARGIGYFSATTMLFISSLLYLSYLRKHKADQFL